MTMASKILSTSMRVLFSTLRFEVKRAAIHKPWFYFGRRFTSQGNKGQQNEMAEHTKDNTNLFKLISKDGPKWKWDGDCKQLNILLEKELSLKGTWSPPEENENVHEFKLDSPTISFNKNKKTLVINGEGSERLKERMLQTENDLPASNSRRQKGMAEHTKDTTNLFDLVSRDDPKLKWGGNFEQLKLLLKTKLSLSGICSSPEENVHEFKVDSPTISFNEIKKTFVINGQGSERLVKRLLISEARSLALQFMFKNPSCIRAIPYEREDTKSLTTCLYMDTNNEEISEEIKIAANEMFGNDKFEFDNLSRRPPSKGFRPLSTSEKTKRQELADINRTIQKNLKLFEDRMNVTAVQASYKVTASIEKNIPCVTVYVLGKGKIPAGETDIREIKDKSRVFHEIEFDVAEGCYKQATGSSRKDSALPLEGGVGIGVENIPATGTLGGFLEDENRNVYILSNQHVLHPTNAAGGAIFQPSQDDYEEMRREAETNIQRWNNERQRILDENEDNQEYRNLLVRSIDQKIRKNTNILSEILQNPPRQIGTYVRGLQGSVLVNGQRFYVDAAIATLDRNEQRVMIYHKNQIEDQANRCPLYGFETNKYWTTADYNPPNGEIINFETFQELLLSDDPELRFMKIGRTTGLTDEGFVKQSPIYIRHIPPNGLHVKFDWGYNCLPIRKHTGSFSEEGDSGSLVFDQNGRAWGLVFGMLMDLETGLTSSIVSPLFAIVARLEQETRIKQLTLWRTPNQE